MEYTISKSDDRAFYACPGAWVGNMPSCFPDKTGNITIDPKRIVAAVRFLSRRYEILESRLSCDPNPGVVLVIRSR